MIFCKCAFLLKCEPVNFVMIDRWIDEGGKKRVKTYSCIKIQSNLQFAFIEYLLTHMAWLCLSRSRKLKLIFLVFRSLCFLNFNGFLFLLFSDNNHLNFVLKEKEEEDKEGTERMDGSCVSTYDYFLIKCTIVIFKTLIMFNFNSILRKSGPLFVFNLLKNDCFQLWKLKKRKNKRFKSLLKLQICSFP